MPYKAFISYSHAADRKLASALQSALHRFAKPWYRLRSVRVFRDKTSLSANPALWPAIEKALSESEYFLLLASPEAASSKWVQQEVDHWRKNASPDKILFVLTDGEVVWDSTAGDFDWHQTTALPETLRGVFREEPLYVDFRWARDKAHLSLTHARFRDNIADLAASLHGVSKDEIAGEDVRQHRRTMRTMLGVISLLIVLTTLSVIATYYAVQQRNVAEQRLARSLLANASAKGAQGRWLQARKVSLEARDLLERQGHSTFPADLGIWRSYAYAPLPLYSYSPRRYFITYMPNSEHGLAVDGSKILRIDFKTLRILGAFAEDEEEILGIWFSSDGNVFVTEGESHTLTVWDYKDRRPKKRLKGHKSENKYLAVSKSGRYLVRSTTDNTTYLWDLVTGKRLFFLAEGERVNGIAFTPDEKSVLLGSNKKKGKVRLALWDVATGKAIREFENKDEAFVLSVAISDDGSLALSGGQFLQLWAIKSGNKVWRFPTAESPIYDVAFSRGGEFMLASMGVPLELFLKGELGIWNVEKGRRFYTFEGHASSLQESIFSPRSGTVLLHHTQDRNFLSEYKNDLDSFVLSPQQGSIMRLEFSPDSRFLVAVHGDGSHSVWDLATRRRTVDFPTAGRRITRLRFSRADKKAVFSAPDGNVGIIDLVDRDKLELIPTHESELVDMALSIDGERMITVGSDKAAKYAAKYWDLRNKKLIKSVSVTDIPVDVEFTLDDTFSIISLSSGFMVWNLRSNDTKEIKDDYLASSWASSVTSNGRYCKGGRDFKVEIWDIQQLAKEASFVGHKFAVTACAFSEDGRWLVSGGFDETLRFWDTQTGQALEVLYQVGKIQSAKWSSDGRYLAVGMADGTIDVLHLSRPREYRQLTEDADNAIAALAVNPKDKDALRKLAHWYAQRKLWSWSVELYEELNLEGEKTKHLDLARGYWMLGKYDNARKEYKEALAAGEAPAFYLDICLDTIELEENYSRSDE